VSGKSKTSVLAGTVAGQWKSSRELRNILWPPSKPPLQPLQRLAGIGFSRSFDHLYERLSTSVTV
jgi:hypothetical protein